MGLYETKEADYEYRKSMRESYNRGYEKAKAEYDAKLEEVKSRFKDCYYNKGYEQGKAEGVPAIPLDWIGKYLAWLKDIGGYGLSDARAVQSMIIKWKMEHTDGCGPDYCEIGGTHND